MKQIFLLLPVIIVFSYSGFTQTWQPLLYSDTAIKGPVYAMDLIGTDIPAWSPFWLEIGGEFDTVNFNTAGYRWNGAQFSNTPYNFCVNGPVYALSYWHWFGTGIAVGGNFSKTCPQTSPQDYANFGIWASGSWYFMDSTQINGVVRALAKDSATGELFVGGEMNELYRLQYTKQIIGTCDGSIYALNYLYSNSNLIVGGFFSQINTVPVNNIAKKNGNAWSSLGAGMNDTVYALTLHNNEIYAGGKFTQADGNPASHIAKWNGTQWMPLGNGMNGVVKALLSYSGKLIAGGEFTLADGNPANNIAMWDGAQWLNVGAGFNGPVYALASYQNELYAGGNFTMSGTDTINYIAKNSIYSGISDSQEFKNNISISPNPTSGMFQIQFATYSGKQYKIEILNVLGEKVFTSTIGHQPLTIDLSSQQYGIYFVRVKTSAGNVTGKIVVLH